MSKTKYAFLDIESTMSGEITQIKLKPCIEGKMMRGTNILVKYNSKKGTAAQQKAHNNNAVCKATAFRNLERYMAKYIDSSNPNDKFVIVAHYAAFDTDKLRQFFTENGSRYYGAWFYQQAICTLQLATAYLAMSDNMNQVQSFKLSDLCTYFKIKVDPTLLHEAEYDVDLLIQLFKKINNAMYRMWKGTNS